MDRDEELSRIWMGDRLDRRQEAESIERFLVKEVDFFRRTHRERSVVLGLDAPYGRGKSWFLDRLSKQLALSHPVAKIDAWSDDFGDEPLVAFMSAIDEALSPYLSRSAKLGDRLAAAKAAAIPVIGKIIAGVTLKAVSKVAGDQIDEQVGTAFEEAVRGVREEKASEEDGAASLALSEAFSKLGSEIDALVDRQGAAMLAAYKQRKLSRETFRTNMRALIAAIDMHGQEIHAPLVVIVDELDRCRPNYAIRVLEEIKHFFEVPGVVFIIGLHGNQLSKSVNAVYGPNFDSEDYLRRFFTRRYELRAADIVELTHFVFREWGIDENKFSCPDLNVDDGYPLSTSRVVGLILSQWQVTPREIYSVMDGLRLFVEDWDYQDRIDVIALLILLVKTVRGADLNLSPIEESGPIVIKGIRWASSSGGSPCTFSISDYLLNLRTFSSQNLSDIMGEQRSRNGARNHAIAVLQAEYNARYNRPPRKSPKKSYILEYVDRVHRLARFVENPDVVS